MAGDCKQGLCFFFCVLIMFPLRVAVSVVRTADPNQPQMQRAPAYCNLVAQENDLSLMLLPPPEPKCRKLQKP